jgi:hypothetical protein
MTIAERQSAFSGILNVGWTLDQALLNGSAPSREMAQIVLEQVVPVQELV